MIEVVLTHGELVVASEVGRWRQLEALRQGLRDAHGFARGDGWTVHIEGACGELAAARALDTHWPATINTFGSGGDLGHGIEVRTRSKDEYDLLVRQADRDGSRFILVTGSGGRYKVWGWEYGSVAKATEFRCKLDPLRPPAFVVPKTRLRPLVELIYQGT